MDYNIYRRDINLDESNDNRAGGVLVAMKKDIHVSSTTTLCDSETIFIKFRLHGMKFLLCATYIPPSSHLSIYENIVQSLEKF